MSKNILLITDGWFHPSITGRFWLSYNLTQPGSGYLFKRIRSIEAISQINLETFHAMVLYFHHKEISVEALKSFDQFVTQGGGVLAIHSATASFQNQDEFTNILGGKFSSHGPIENFTVNPISPKSAIFGGIPGFTVKDELYIHDLQPDIQPHFHTSVNRKPIPIVWTRKHGKGWICYIVPGHRAASLRAPEVRQILTRGLEWVCKP